MTKNFTVFIYFKFQMNSYSVDPLGAQFVFLQMNCDRSFHDYTSSEHRTFVTPFVHIFLHFYINSNYVRIIFKNSRETRCEVMDGIHLAQDTVDCHDFMDVRVL